jgi:hypothetical protein
MKRREAERGTAAMTEANLYAEWRAGDALAVGRALLEPLRFAERAVRATAVLARCRDAWPPVPELERVVGIGRLRWRWYEAHEAFQAVRQLTLQEGRSPTSTAYARLLIVGELAAKTIFNASNTMAPFDADTPWYLASAARRFVDAVGDETLALAVWEALTGGPPGRPPTYPWHS